MHLGTAGLAVAGGASFDAVFGVFVVAFVVLVVVTLRWAVRRDRAGRAQWVERRSAEEHAAANPSAQTNGHAPRRSGHGQGRQGQSQGRQGQVPDPRQGRQGQVPDGRQGQVPDPRQGHGQGRGLQGQGQVPDPRQGQVQGQGRGRRRGPGQLR